jgi:hypothetical protein
MRTSSGRGSSSSVPTSPGYSSCALAGAPGPAGLGILRAAPAVGALLAAAVLTRRPLVRRAGRTLLIVVGLYGASIIVFGLSRFYVLSLVALGVSGFVDLFSMNIRSTTVALATPDRLRGRVAAVEMVFISASNQLGAFESGLTAFLVGSVPAVVGGGAITVAIAASWSRIFPDLARVDSLQDVRPAPAAPSVPAQPAAAGPGAASPARSARGRRSRGPWAARCAGRPRPPAAR